ncbi:MAG: PEP-utilizing enzyme [Candidatus Diapherotrites archaeon]|nr:PEP-utilizing enzyme [Candidatus Diapherotrites archaeon]
MKEKLVIAEEETDVSVFPYIFGWYGWMRTLSKHGITGPETGFFESDSGNLNILVKMSDFAHTSDCVLKRFAEDKTFLEYVEQNVEKTGKELVEFAEKKIFKDDLSKKPNKELLELYTEYRKLQTELYGIGVVNSAADFTGKLSEKIQNYLEGQNKKLKLNENVPDAFSILTTPSKLSLMQKQDIEFFKVLQFVQEKKINDLDKNSELQKKLEFLEKEFGWLSYHYEGPVQWTKDYFSDLIKAETNGKINAKKMVEELSSRTEVTEKHQIEFVKKFQISEEIQYWIRVAQSCVFFKGVRKEFLIKSHMFVEPLVKEISKRLHISQNQMRFIMPDEMKQALLENKFDEKELNSRYKHCITLTHLDKDVVLIGREAEQFANKNIQKLEIEGITELKGVCACSGKAKGIARKINRTGHIPKMEQGDILISSVTSPSLVPAMKKASAIVTDMGGLASHAAIVSREIGVPCIIGTKIATKIFQDGDLLEVDAGKGIVRILKKAKK